MKGALQRTLVLLLIAAVLPGCTVRPRVSGSYQGSASSSGVEGAGSLNLSQPF